MYFCTFCVSSAYSRDCKIMDVMPWKYRNIIHSASIKSVVYIAITHIRLRFRFYTRGCGDWKSIQLKANTIQTIRCFCCAKQLPFLCLFDNIVIVSTYDWWYIKTFAAKYFINRIHGRSPNWQVNLFAIRKLITICWTSEEFVRHSINSKCAFVVATRNGDFTSKFE